MTTVSPAELIEDYLRSRRMRYFRGHHDDEYFFLINTNFGRVHVHLQPCGESADDEVKISIGAQYYRRVARQAQVEAVVTRWNQTGPWATAMVYRSSDPRLIGIAAHNRCRAADAADLGTVVDQTVQSAIELFGRLRSAVPPDAAVVEPLRDAG